MGLFLRDEFYVMKIKKADASLYGTLENRINGVVITFSKITAAKTVERQLRQTLAETEKPLKVKTS